MNLNGNSLDWNPKLKGDDFRILTFISFHFLDFKTCKMNFKISARIRFSLQKNVTNSFAREPFKTKQFSEKIK